MPLNAQISLSILAHETSAGDLSRTLRATPANYAAALTDGTGANQAQVVWSDAGTLAGAQATLNLSALADVRDGATATVSFSAIKCLYFRNASAGVITLGGAAIGAVGVGSTRIVRAGAVTVDVVSSSEGIDVSSSPSLIINGQAGYSYEIVLIGEGTIS